MDSFFSQGHLCEIERKRFGQNLIPFSYRSCSLYIPCVLYSGCSRRLVLIGLEIDTGVPRTLLSISRKYTWKNVDPYILPRDKFQIGLFSLG